ncbi:rho GTPase-activating protein gacT isoform X3 [Zeugodacus cucurbitae]|uniref:rho GTPase-activating protein gacT isoform X3 n=1 Tax=Zeugodacus cucurbitae TaxID=28588 RepID=UPI0023D958AC|nr:rho GTPase-activating protein gacT isoform X3 [Zeugodacus cucurbitae]
MSSWARRAADISSVVTSCGHPGASAPDYTYRLEKVKFGVPLEEVCKNNENIPGPLLVLILKLNKESPNRRDVFRAPGHQGAMKKLIHFLQSGRLVNVDNYSVYTIASVLKKFLRKIPNGIFGRTGEKELFDIIELDNELEQTDRLHRLFTSLPKYTQRLLVLLFGTFRVIASNATQASTGMTSEALGVSVAPSFFQSCVSDGKTARMEDVLKFKVATKIMKQIIDKFATHDLFGRENYEYYARVTGRILKVQDEWICSFQYPPPPRGKLAQQKYALQHSLEAEKTWLQCQCERWGLLAQEESRSTPALLTSSSSALDNSVLSLGVTPEHSFIESCARLSVSLEGPSLFALTSSPIPKRNIQDLQRDTDNDADVDEENYGDEDADVHDDGEIEDFAAELEINNDEDFENNPKHNYPTYTAVQSGTHRATAAAGNNRYAMPTHGNAALNTTYTVSNDNDDVVDSNDDDGDDEVTVVRRRYRQNKKKILTQTRMQHQRRLRAGSKSLDGGDRVTQTPMNNETNENRNKMKNNKIQIATTTQMTSGTTSGGIKTTSRTCSRCNRGIRHSSSCSSASGGAGAGSVGNGSGMTMEELRAVNRYAESTKSLSYLPQVHERQTARMRTRSEWFLGPRDSELALNLPNTCSNCCLAAVQKQQLQLQQQHPHFPAHGYLGGGSTRDMRAHCGGYDDDDEDDNVHNLIVSSSSGGHNANALYMYYKKRLQQQQKIHANAQQAMQTEHMDTDDSSNAYEYGTPMYQCRQQQEKQQHLQVDNSNIYAQTPELRLMEPTTSSAFAAASNSSGRRMYLDPNTTAATNIATKSVSTHYEPHQRNHQHFSSQTRQIDSSSYSHTHSQSPNHQRQRQQQKPKRGSKLPSHYHSTDSVRYCDVDLDVEIVTECPTMSTSRLFYSPRKQIYAARRCNSTHELYKIDGADVEGNSDIDHNYLTYSLPSDHNDADFDTITVPSTLSNRAESCEIYSDSSEFLHASLLDNSLAINGASGLPLAAAEEVDFIHTSRYRQSTPRVQRRQQQLRRRQRFASTSTQYHSMNSTNASTLLMTTADGGNGSDSGNGRNTRTESGNNFVTVIFNVLDFLF